MHGQARALGDADDEIDIKEGFGQVEIHRVVEGADGADFIEVEIDEAIVKVGDNFAVAGLFGRLHDAVAARLME